MGVERRKEKAHTVHEDDDLRPEDRGGKGLVSLHLVHFDQRVKPKNQPCVVLPIKFSGVHAVFM